jgi:hypothetical protein
MTKEERTKLDQEHKDFIERQKVRDEETVKSFWEGIYRIFPPRKKQKKN